MSDCHCTKDELIEPVSRDIEGLLIQQLGEEFVLLEITTKCGETRLLRSNSAEAIEAQDEKLLPEKKFFLNDVQNESRIAYTGSPRCQIRIRNGRITVVNLDGGPVSDCYK